MQPCDEELCGRRARLRARIENMSNNGSEKKVLIPEKEVTVLTEVDVCVTGGGTAGFVAAIAAARTGAKVALVERNGYLGGANTATYNTSVGWLGDSDGHRIIGGPGFEFLERMEAAGEAFITRGDGTGKKRWNDTIFPESTKRYALEMVAEEPNIELFLHTWAGDVLMDGERITGLVVQSKSGRQVILAKAFADCSADGDVAASAGAPYERLGVEHPQQWQVSIDLTVCNIDAKRVIRWCHENKDHLEGEGVGIPDLDSDCTGIQSGVSINLKTEESQVMEKQFGKSGRVLQGRTSVGTRPTLKLMIRRSTTRVQGNVEIDPTDVKQLTWAEVEGRRRAYKHLQYMKDTIDGMQDAFIVSQNQLGVRVARRILGEYYVTIDNLVENTRIPDVVSLNCRCLDKHLAGERFVNHYLEGNHDVPYRALLPLKTENLTIGGRCISCDHESHASLRGAATCWGTGHAAGTSAALAALDCEGRVREVNIRRLQNMLIEQKAVLTTEGRTFDDEVEVEFKGESEAISAGTVGQAL